MLDSQTIAIVKSTIPVLVETGPKLTGYFYERMFKHNPELKDIFNLSHQQSGAQREALFGAICAYASNIENLSAILPAVERIAQKHASFNIQPEQYNIVGHHLLATIDELLHPGTEVIEAWGKAYQVLANVFIQREAQIYQQTADEQGGWKGLREFRIVKKQKESDVITSFEMAPVDNKPVVDYAAGQYIAVYLQGEQLENQEIRQYSLTRSPNGKTYRIAVKREDQGKASNYLHNVIQEGDILSLAPPYGDFFIDVKPEVPVVLISAGVGLTPMLGMLNTLKAQNHQGNIYWLHAAENGAAAAFRNEVTEITDAMANVRQQVWYNHPNSDDIAGVDYHHRGLMQLDMSEHRLFSPDMQYYFCGPVAFMQYIAKQLTQRGVKTEQLHYECFGPHKIV